MKIAKRDIAVIMVIVALLVVFCSYKFSWTPNQEAKEKEEARQSELQVQIDQVKARAAEQPRMEKEMAAWQEEISKAIQPFHSRYLYEDGIMYVKNLEEQAENENTPFEVKIKTWTVAESGYSNTISGQGCFTGTTYASGTTSYNYNYDITGYDQLKNLINYIVSEKDGSGVKSLDSMSFTYNKATGEKFTGTIVMTVYAITDGNNPYEPQNLEDVEQQITNDNIFGLTAEGDNQ